MSLGLKSLLWMALVVTLSVLAQFSILGKVALPGILTAERVAAVDRLQRARAAVGDDRRQLEDFARDWAAWQETAEYLANPAADYPFADLVSGTLLAEDIDLFGLYDVKGGLVWGALPERRLAAIAVDAEDLEAYLAAGLTLPADRTQIPTAITDVAGRAAFIAVKPVSYEAYGAGVVGYLAMLRFIDGDVMTRWERLIGGAIELAPVTAATSAQEPARSSEPVSMRVALDDVNGEPSFWLTVAVDDKAFQSALAGMRQSMNYTLVVGAATFFILLLGQQQFVLRRVSRLAREILTVARAEWAGSGRRLNLRGRDEVAVIAGEVNDLLDRLEEATGGSVSKSPDPRERPGMLE